MVGTSQPFSPEGSAVDLLYVVLNFLVFLWGHSVAEAVKTPNHYCLDYYCVIRTVYFTGSNGGAFFLPSGHSRYYSKKSGISPETAI